MPRIACLPERNFANGCAARQAQMFNVESEVVRWKLFSEAFSNPDPELRYLIDEARPAIQR